MSLTSKLTQKISTELNYDEERSAVISYGIFAFLQILTALALVALFGALLGVLIQALVVSFASSILRQYSGGVHATRPSICLIIGTVVTIAIASIVHYLIVLIPFEYAVLFNIVIIPISYFMILKYAPVDSPSKPIKTEAKKRKMKKLSLIILSVYVVIVIVFLTIYSVKGNSFYMECAMCISIATCWQIFNLTIIGHRVLKKVDSSINKLLFKEEKNK